MPRRKPSTKTYLRTKVLKDIPSKPVLSEFPDLSEVMADVEQVLGFPTGTLAAIMEKQRQAEAAQLDRERAMWRAYKEVERSKDEALVKEMKRRSRIKAGGGGGG